MIWTGVQTCALPISPEQALRTATTNAAELLGHPTELGAIAPGYFADLVAVEGDPLANIDVAIKNVRWVMKSATVLVDKSSNSSPPYPTQRPGHFHASPNKP